MLSDREISERFKRIMLELEDKSDNFDDYMNEVDELISNVANKTDLYTELIRFWLDEKIELKESHLKIIYDYLNIIINKKNCVNLSTAMARGYVYIKFDLNDGFTDGFIKDVYDNSFDLSDYEDKRAFEISNEMLNNEPIRIREILFIISYLYVEEEYDYILKKLMVYEVRED